VESAADAVAGINPLVTLVQHPVRITADTAAALIADYDLVLDGTDNFPTRYLVNDACVLAGKPYVWGSILRFEGQVSVFWAEHGPHYRDVYPHPPPEGSVPSCAQAGVLGALCATIGSLMVTEAVKLICGIGETLVGRLLIYDAVDLTFRTVRVRRDPLASPVSALPDDAGAARAAGVAGSGAGSAGAGAGADDDLAAHTIAPAVLKRRLDAGEDLLLVDVREPGEREIASIVGSVPIGQDEIVSGAALDRLPRDRRIVLHCRSGGRSAQALRVLHAAGFADAEHLAGGILAWIDDVEPALPRY
jgi:adenylyltransferase/sulfurtransferase